MHNDQYHDTLMKHENQFLISLPTKFDFLGPDGLVHTNVEH